MARIAQDHQRPDADDHHGEQFAFRGISLCRNEYRADEHTGGGHGRNRREHVTFEQPAHDGPQGERPAEDGEQVLARAKAWWAAYPDKTCAQPTPTYFGEHPLHVVLERTVWHPAQHTRQLMLVLESLGIAPDRPLGAADLAGLPLPAKAWDED